MHLSLKRLYCKRNYYLCSMKEIDSYDGSMPLRNLRHERFAQEYVANGGNASEAYRASGYTPKLAEKKASRLLTDDRVKLRIRYLRKEYMDHWREEYYGEVKKNVETLKGIRDSKKAKDSDRISAVRTMNEMVGFNAPTKQEVTGADGRPLVQSDEELEAKIEELRRKMERCE